MLMVSDTAGAGMEGAPQVLAERSGAMSGSGTLERRIAEEFRLEKKKRGNFKNCYLRNDVLL